MEQVRERMNNLLDIIQELDARVGCNSTNADFRYFSWEQLCQEAKDILQWLKVYGQ